MKNPSSQQTESYRACTAVFRRAASGLLAAGALAVCAPGSGLAEAQEAPTVRAVQPDNATLRRTTVQPATIHALHEARIYARVTGYLKTLHVDIGDTVRAGVPLAEIDVPEMVKRQEQAVAEVARLESEKLRFDAAVEVAAARVEEARAAVAEAEAQAAAYASEYARVKSLSETGAVTERTRDEAYHRLAAGEASVVARKANGVVAQAEVRAARADVAAAAAAVSVVRKNLEALDVLLDYATLRAPFDGVVTQRNVDPGDLVKESQPGSGGMPLFTVAQIDRLRIRTAIPERDAPWANPGDKAVFAGDGLRGQVFEGAVTRTAGMLDPATRMMTVEFELDNPVVGNPGHRLLPGMFGNVTIYLAEHENSLAVPAASLRTAAAGAAPHVYVVGPDNRVRHVQVTTGLDDGSMVEIVSGLTGTERVVTGMLGRLADGQMVRVLE